MNAQNDTLRFAIAGHGYGAHAGSNIGLHQPFLNALDRVPNRHEFLILTGDIVRNSNTQSWNAVASELDSRNITSYYVRGNHDRGQAATDVFLSKHNGNYYSFKKDSILFVVLNSGQYDAYVQPNEIAFLDSTLLEQQDSVNTVLVLFHFLLWNSDIKYKDIKSNLGSQYSYLKNTANYWSNIYPLLSRHPETNFYVVAGDLAGRSYALPAYYEDRGHIKLIASGMGEVAEENYLEWTFTKSGVDIDVIPLNNILPVKNIEDYEYFSSVSTLKVPQENLSIYGNKIHWQGSNTLNVSIFNLRGQIIENYMLEPNSEKVLPNSPESIYLVRATNGSQYWQEKVLNHSFLGQ